MGHLTFARGIYRATAEASNGERLAVFTGELQRAADALEQPDEKEVGTLAEGARSEAREVLVQGESSHETTSEAALHLRGAAESLKQAMGEVNPRMEVLPENKAGQASLGQDGSEVVDPLTPLIEGGGQLIDSEWARAVATHEEFHAEQKQPDVEVAGNSVTAHEFLEAGAIAAQLKVAPQSFNRLSTEYQALYRKVLGLLPDREKVMELSREGKLKQFEKEVGSARDALAA